MSEYFVLTDDHIKLLSRYYWSWDGCEYGAPAVDCKRPFGNSDVESDVREILDREVTEYECSRLCHSMITVMQIISHTLSVKTGVYRKTEPYDGKWEFVRAFVAKETPQ